MNEDTKAQLRNASFFADSIASKAFIWMAASDYSWAWALGAAGFFTALGAFLF